GTAARRRRRREPSKAELSARMYTLERECCRLFADRMSEARWRSRAPAAPGIAVNVRGTGFIWEEFKDERNAGRRAVQFYHEDQPQVASGGRCRAGRRDDAAGLRPGTGVAAEAGRHA